MESETAHTGYRQGVHHIALSIPPGTEAQVRAFYGDVLGMTEISPTDSRGAPGCHFRAGDLEFDFHVEPSAQPPRETHPGTMVTDIDALAARLAELGITIEWDHKFPGYRRFYARDPVGNRLQFLQSDSVRGPV
jgi:catechol 2,3-dioxygenase-like lactoylglutathione lyase family enzyme